MKEEEFEKCKSCAQNLLLKEIEVYGELHEIGAYCANETCERYSILLA